MMPLTALALVSTGVLHTLVSLLLLVQLPVYLPIGFDLSLAPVLAAPRGVVLLVILGLGALIGGSAAAAAVAVQRSRTELAADRMRHLGAATLLFLTFEVAAVYSTLGGAATASWTEGDAATYSSASFAVVAFQDAGGRLPTAALVIASLYLVYLVAWAATIRRSPRPAPAGVDQLS